MKNKLDVSVVVQTWPDSSTVTARHEGREVGILNTMLKEKLGVAKVLTVRVDKDVRGRGIATQLYEAAARDACDRMGVPLASGVQRSPEAQAFWEKQVAKGRAVVDADPEVGRDFFRMACPAPKTLGQALRARVRRK